MQFKVNRAFKFNGIIRMPGQIVELDIERAARLRSMGLIGQAEQAISPPTERAVAPKPEQAVKRPTEKRIYKPRKKKVEDEAPADSAAGD